jgi:hypothetical protein
MLTSHEQTWDRFVRFIDTQDRELCGQPEDASVDGEAEKATLLGSGRFKHLPHRSRPRYCFW